MTTNEAKRLVVTALVLGGSLAAVRDLSTGRPPRLRIFLGILVAGAILAAGAEIAPQFAAAFAMLLLVTAIFVLGGDALTAISRVLGGTASERR